MKILLLTPTPPYPAHQGGALRNLGILRGLASAGHAVTLLSFADTAPADLPALNDALRPLCERILLVPPPPRPLTARLRDLALTRQPDLARRLESAPFRAQLAALLRETAFDLVQFEGLEMAIYLSQVRQQQPSARLVYDAHNAEAALQAVIAGVAVTSVKGLPGAIYSRIQAARIAAFERTICRAADGVIAVSEDDAAALRLFREDRRVSVLPNGIFAADYAAAATLDLGQNVLVFTGKMDYRPNVDAMQWFVNSILPRVTAQVPAARLYIVGQKPHPSLTGFSDQAHVHITGWVAQVQPFLGAADVYIAPLRMGSGTRLKILEAMAAGRPVVATRTAAAGLSAEAQAALLLTDEADDFAAAIVRLLSDPAERDRLGSAARAVVTTQYDWSALIPCLHDIHRTIIDAPR